MACRRHRCVCQVLAILFMATEFAALKMLAERERSAASGFVVGRGYRSGSTFSAAVVAEGLGHDRAARRTLISSTGGLYLLFAFVKDLQGTYALSVLLRSSIVECRFEFAVRHDSHVLIGCVGHGRACVEVGSDSSLGLGWITVGCESIHQ